MEEGSFTRQRRNVFVISLIIITYTVAGGDLEKIRFYGMVLENTWALALGVWIAFGYSLLRYRLYSSAKVKKEYRGNLKNISPNEEFAQELVIFLRKRPRFQAMMREVFKADYEKFYEQKVTAGEHGEEFRADHVVLQESKGITPTKFQYKYPGTNLKANKPVKPGRMWRSIAPEVIPFMKESPIATDVLLPYMVAGMAVLAAVIALIVPDAPSAAAACKEVVDSTRNQS